MPRSEIIIKNMQIKSEEKIQILAGALEEIEIECGIKEVKITFENVFVCPWIDLKSEKFRSPMEKLLVNLIKKLKSK